MSTPPLVFNPEMLVVARARARLTQSEVGTRAGMRQAIVSKIELGVRPPSPDEVRALAAALSVPPNFFDRPSDRFVAVPPLFRLQRRRVSKMGIDQLHAEMYTRAVHLRTLLQSAQLAPTLPMPSRLVDATPAEAAQYLRDLWLIRPGPVPNLTALCEAAGIFIYEIDSPVREFEGALFRAADLPTIIFVRRGQPADRRRLTIAHELMHLILHDTETDEAEQEAFDGAGEFLFPAADVRKHLGRQPQLRHLRDLKPIWRVSINAMVVRAERAGVIDARRKQSLYQQLSMYGWRQVEPDPLPDEPAVLVRNVLDFVRSALEYTTEDLAAAFRELPAQVTSMYAGFLTTGRDMPQRLRLV